MKHSTTTSYRISNNLSGGRRKRGAVGKAPPGVKPTKSVIELAQGPDAEVGEAKGIPAGGTPLRKGKQASRPEVHAEVSRSQQG